MVVPVLWLLFASTKNAADLYGTSAYSLGNFALFENIAAVAAQDGGIFFRWMGNSVLYAGFGAVVRRADLRHGRLRLRQVPVPRQGLLFGFVLVGVLIPNTATVLPMYLLAS